MQGGAQMAPSRRDEFRTLFLDFDGVMHQSYVKPVQWFAHVEKLAERLVRTEREIVTNSSWRFSPDLKAMQQLLPATLARRVVGSTGLAIIGKFSRYR